MSNWKRIPSGRFRGKEIAFAETAMVEEYRDVADDFMSEVFDLLPGSYVISDESSLADFVESETSGLSAIWQIVRELYGVDHEHVGSNRLVDIFSVIRALDRPQ